MSGVVIAYVIAAMFSFVCVYVGTFAIAVKGEASASDDQSVRAGGDEIGYAFFMAVVAPIIVMMFVGADVHDERLVSLMALLWVIYVFTAYLLCRYILVPLTLRRREESTRQDVVVAMADAKSSLFNDSDEECAEEEEG